MEKFNNPDLIFGKDNMPYLLMIYDWVGAGSPFGGGCTMVLGYQYNNALHGVQVKIKYNDGIRIRYMNEGNWTNWKVISIA